MSALWYSLRGPLLVGGAGLQLLVSTWVLIAQLITPKTERGQTVSSANQRLDEIQNSTRYKGRK
jgi:hypothetical protein